MAPADSPPNPRPLGVVRSPATPSPEGESPARTGQHRAELHELEVGRLPDHLEPLYRAALLLTGSREDAEDLVQETCVRVLRRPRFLRRGGEPAYLMRALRNTWLDGRRAPRLETAEPDELGVPSVEAPGPDVMLSLEARALLVAVSQLPPVYRETFVAVDVLGLSYKEAARALRTKEGTVMSRLFRARLRIARTLGTEPSRS